MAAATATTTTWSFAGDVAASEPAAKGAAVTVGSTTSESASSDALRRQNSVVEVTCPICWTDVKSHLTVPFYPCEHRLCRPCSIQQVRSTLLPGAKGVECPVCVDTGGWVPEQHPVAVSSALRRKSSAAAAGAGGAPGGCGAGTSTAAATSSLRAPSAVRPVFGELTEPYMRRLQAWSARRTTVLPGGVRPLTTDDVLRFIRATVGAAVERASAGKEKLVRCPHLGCHALLIVDGCGAQAREPCPHCRNDLCVACGASWLPGHADGGTCGDVAKATTAQIAESIFQKRQGSTYKLCPGCGEAITHFYDHGCHHMSCNCGSYWCYVCAEAIEGEHDCPQFCEDGSCRCPPCPTCYASGGAGCDMCERECRVCQKLGMGESLYDPSYEDAYFEHWAHYFDDHAEDAAALESGTLLLTAAELGHDGTWRNVEEGLAYFCSLPGMVNGPLCKHSHGPRFAVIEGPHWSCCGARGRNDNCKPVPAAPVSVAREPSGAAPPPAAAPIAPVPAAPAAAADAGEASAAVAGAGEAPVGRAASEGGGRAHQAPLRVGDVVGLDRFVGPDRVVFMEHHHLATVTGVDPVTRRVQLQARALRAGTDPDAPVRTGEFPESALVRVPRAVPAAVALQLLGVHDG